MNINANNCDSLEDAIKTIHNSAINKAHRQYQNDNYDNVENGAIKWLQQGQISRRNQDHADTADQFIGGELWVKPATTSVTTYTNKIIAPQNAVKTYKAGTFIGVVKSYVTNPAMFQTEDNQFVPIETSTFDREKMDASLAKVKATQQAEIDKKVQARNEEAYKTNSLYALGVDARNAKDKVVDTVGSALSFGGDFIKWGLIIGGLVLAYTFYVKYSQ